MATPKKPGSPGRGGKRAGAGRPAGSDNALPLGAVKAIKATGLRVPENATPEARALADHAQQRIVDVMNEDVDAFRAGSVLKAATHLRLEICGDVTRKVEASGPDGGPLEVIVKTVAE